MSISCQNNNPRLINSDYIYRKIHKKGQNLSKGFALIGKRYHNNFL